MNAPITIRVTPYLTPLPREGQTGTPRYRYRWRAELVEHDHQDRCDFVSEGHGTPDEAIGAVVLEAVRCLDGCDGGFELIAALFTNPATMPATLSIGRALRLASRNPKRQHPGCVVEIGEPGEALPPGSSAKGRQALKPVTPSTLTPTDFAKCNAVLASVATKRKGGAL